jgi:hypothetical protein
VTATTGHGAPFRRYGPEWVDPRFLTEAEEHRRDLPRFCPRCAASLGDGSAVELWEGTRRVYTCWCPACSWSGEIVPTPGGGVVGHEPEH